MTDDDLAEFQRRLLNALAVGDLSELGEQASGHEVLRRYVESFDPDAIALAIELWQEWGRRTGEPSS